MKSRCLIEFTFLLDCIRCAIALSLIPLAIESKVQALYPASVPNLIADYFRNYKRIKLLTLFLCDTSWLGFSNVSSPSPPAFGSYDPVFASPLPVLLQQPQYHHRQLLTSHASGYLNFQQIVKHLMTTGNFLIKGDGNIDATEPLRSNDPFYVPDMLKCGDFKQGVVLDLRCRRAKFILQQVKSNQIKEPGQLNPVVTLRIMYLLL